MKNQRVIFYITLILVFCTCFGTQNFVLGEETILTPQFWQEGDKPLIAKPLDEPSADEKSVPDTQQIEETSDSEDVPPGELTESQPVGEATPSPDVTNTPPQTFDYVSEEELNEQIKDLNDEIQSNRQKIKKLQAQQEKLNAEIQKTHSEKATLNNQLAILENRMAKAELDILNVETEIERTNLEIEKTNLAISHQIGRIEEEKGDLINVLNLISRQDRVSTLEVLLLNNSLAEFLNQVKYLEDLNEEVGESVDDLKQGQRALEKENEKLKKQNEELALQKTEMEKKKAALETEKENKAYVVIQLDVSEKQYQRLLAQAKAEQEAAAVEITTYEKKVRAKIAELEGKELEFNDNGFIWPVPKNVVTSYFHDPDYPFRYIFEHPAIDIRAKQGTTIRAAASGYVARVKNGGKGYSYIMLVHGDGLSTVYGHTSKMSVREDEYVIQGQTIGASGGLPGTPGAGSLTTGPHLHFEIRLNGIPVDPLAYLP